MWVIGHVFFYPGPTVDLLVCRGDDEEATQRAQALELILNGHGQLHVCSRQSLPPVLAEAYNAAVILIASLLI